MFGSITYNENLRNFDVWSLDFGVNGWNRDIKKPGKCMTIYQEYF